MSARPVSKYAFHWDSKLGRGGVALYFDDAPTYTIPMDSLSEIAALVSLLRSDRLSCNSDTGYIQSDQSSVDEEKK